MQHRPAWQVLRWVSNGLGRHFPGRIYGPAGVQSRVCQRFLDDEGIDTIDRPAHSLDLNPIEYLWDINALGGFQTHPGQFRSAPKPCLRYGRISISGISVGLSEASPGVVERVFKHVGAIPAIDVSFQCDYINGRSFGANPYLDYYFAFQHDLSSNDYSPFALANIAQLCSRLGISINRKL